MGEGLQREAKQCGGISIGTTEYVWDYNKNKAVKESKFTSRKKDLSDKAKEKLLCVSYKIGKKSM